MALPYTVDTLDGFDDAVKGLYVENNGKYSLSVEGLPEIPSDYNDIKTSLEKLEANNQVLLKQKAEAKKAADQAILDAAKSSGDVAAIEASYQDKLTSIETSWQEKYKNLEGTFNQSDSQYKGMINNLTVGATASSIANEISIAGSAAAFIPHISSRLQVEIKNGKPDLKVLDANGNLSAMTVEELKAEFVNNPIFAGIVDGTKARGSGPSNGGGGGGVVRMKQSDFNAMSPADRKEFILNPNNELVD